MITRFPRGAYIVTRPPADETWSNRKSLQFFMYFKPECGGEVGAFKLFLNSFQFKKEKVASGRL